MTIGQSEKDTIFHVAPVVEVTPGKSAGSWATEKHDANISNNNNKIDCLSGIAPSSGNCEVSVTKTGGKKRKSLRRRHNKIKKKKYIYKKIKIKKTFCISIHKKNISEFKGKTKTPVEVKKLKYAVLRNNEIYANKKNTKN